MMSEERTSSRGKKEAWEWIKALAVAIALAVLIRSFLFAPFIVEGESMETTLHNNEKLVVNKAVYLLREPQRGEIVVFHAEAGRDYIKRVIGVPGDTVEMRDDTLYINGKAVPEPYLEENREKVREEDKPLTDDFGPVTVPEGQIFVLGDNRQNSHDSRALGSISIDSVVGRAEFVYWPLDQIRWTR
jgi:signal peptidase I